MEDQVEIPIVTTADTKGAQQTAAALQAVEKATAQSGEASQDAGKNAEFLGLKHNELKKAVRELGREFPLAGQAARAMMNPIGAALSAAIGLFALAKQKLDEWNASMDEAAKQAADATFQAGIMAKKEALHQASIAQAEFVEGLKAMQAGQDGAIKKLEASIAKWHDYAAAQTEVNNAQEASQLAQINLQEKLGKITPEQGISSRAAVRRKFERAADDLKTRTEQNELAAKQAELDNATVAGPQLLARQADAAKNATAVAGRLKQQQTDFQKLVGVGGTIGKPVEGSMLSNAIADSAAKNKELEDLQFHGIPLAGPGIMRGKEQAAQSAQERVSMLRANAQRFQDSMDKISSEQLPLAQQAAKTAADKVTSNESRRLSLTDETEKMRASQMTARRARGIVGNLNSDTSAADEFSQLAGTDVGKMLIEGGHEAHIMRAGHAAQTAKDQGRPLPGGDQMISAAQTLSGAQSNVANSVANLLKNSSQSSEKILQMLESLITSQLSTQQRLDLLQQMIRNVDSKQKFIGPN